MKDPVVIAEYDPEWPRKFEIDRALLERAFEGTATIEHVGSTSVPGLAAKPVIDIMAGVPSLYEATARISKLSRIGYAYVSEYEQQMPERRYFRKPRAGKREYHLHCVVQGSAFWETHLLFRDYLRVNPDVAADYARLKRELAAICGSDRDAYLEGKSLFIGQVLSRARAVRS